MKKMISIILCALMLANLGMYAGASPAPVPAPAPGGVITVIIDGNKQSFDLAPVLVNGNPLLPLRAVCDALGIKTAWDDATSTITASRGSVEATLKIGDIKAAANGKDVAIGQPAVIVSGNVMAPASFIAGCFGVKANWDAASQTIVIGSKEKDEWWFKYPTQSEYHLAESISPRSVRGNIGADFGWGALTQKLNYEEVSFVMDELKPAGKKVLSYFEGSGQTRTFAVGYMKNADGSFSSMFPATGKGYGAAPMPSLNAWGWTQENLATYTNFQDFTGIHSIVNDEDIAKPGYTMAALNHPMPKYPDGRDATGYLNIEGLQYPFNAAVYDATMIKDINGLLTLEPSMDTAINVANIGGVTIGPTNLKSYPGKNTGDIVYFTDMQMHKDVSSPFWPDYTKVIAKAFMMYELDGAWFDNMSLWDNFNDMNNMFGDWTEYKFNLYLRNNFTAGELAQMGISDINTFNIRAYMKQKAADYGASNPANPGDPAYKKAEWYSDRVWNIFKVFKSIEGSNHARAVYSAIKDESGKAGLAEGFAVIGNDVPALNHGWMEDGWLDMCGTETSPIGWSLAFGSRGLMDLPTGKLSVFYKLQLEHQDGPYAVPWYYAGGSQVATKPEVSKVLLAEAFANHTFIAAANGRAGTVASHRWLNDFAYAAEDELSPRYQHADIGLYFSRGDQLNFSVPGNTAQGMNLDNNYHMFSLYGFAQALTDAHIPYRYITDWKMNDQVLKSIKTLIVPNAEALDDDAVRMLETFVNNGGRLVMTGPVGLRHSFGGLLAKRSAAALSSLAGTDISGAKGVDPTLGSNVSGTIVSRNVGSGEVAWMARPIGYDYYFLNAAGRPGLLGDLTGFVGSAGIFDGGSLPLNVGSYLWKSTDGKTLFVDLVNYDIDAASDRIFDQGALNFRIRLPEGATSANAKAISPDGDFTVAAVVNGGYIDVTVPSLHIYTSVKITTEASGGGVTPTAALKLSTAAHNVKAGDYFTLNAAFDDRQDSNAAILEFAFDGSKFEYAGFSPAAGVTVVNTGYGAGCARITLISMDYDLKELGVIMLRAKEDAVLANEFQTVGVSADYVIKKADGTKEILAAAGSAKFTTLGGSGGGPALPGDTNFDGVLDLIDLSNMIDWFGLDTSDASWDTLYIFFDFNNNGAIDISDIAYVAQRI